MIRALLTGVVRLLIWFFAFYVVAAIVRGIFRAFSQRPASDASVGSSRPERPGSGPASEPPVEYRDVKDARFSDLSNRTSDDRPS